MISMLKEFQKSIVETDYGNSVLISRDFFIGMQMCFCFFLWQSLVRDWGMTVTVQFKGIR